MFGATLYYTNYAGWMNFDNQSEYRMKESAALCTTCERRIPIVYKVSWASDCASTCTKHTDGEHTFAILEPDRYVYWSKAASGHPEFFCETCAESFKPPPQRVDILHVKPKRVELLR